VEARQFGPSREMLSGSDPHPAPST
jgi:hypothetical protein